MVNRSVLVGTIAVAISLVSIGCVSKGRYDLAVQQRDDYRQRVDFLTRSESVLRSDLEAGRTEMTELQETQKDLGVLLSAYIEAKQIKMQAMQSGVFVVLQNDVLFATGSADLNDGGREVLAGISKELNEIPYQVVVAGHTDNVPIGPALAARYPTNWDLAASRASHVATLLQEQGVAPERLVAVSFGAYQPVASNDTEKGRAENRRIELRLRPVVP